MSHVVVPWPTTRAVFLAQHTIAVAVAPLHDLGERALVLLDRDLAVAIAVEQLKFANHLDMPRLEPQALELLKRQAEILVDIELGVPGSAVLVDLTLAELPGLVGVISRRDIANPLAHAATTPVVARLIGDQITGGEAKAGQGSDARCDEGE